MEHLRTRGAALVVALFLLLSVAGVAGAAHVILPTVAAPQAQDQVANDQGDEQAADEDQDEDTTDDQTTTEDQDTNAPETDAQGAQGEHGALVSAVAQNEACVGGPNDNHGWAVSQVARGLLVPDAVTGCPIWVAPTVTSDTTDTTTDAAVHGKSAEHRQDAAAKANKANKKHGRP